MHGESPKEAISCPACESGELRPLGRLSMRCDDCGNVLGGPLLRTLLDVVSLPETGCRNPDAPPSGDGRSGWVDYYLSQYRRLLNPGRKNMLERPDYLSDDEKTT